MTEHTGEKCARCGCVGEDRRTLWMACFYAMHELKVPFEEAQIKGTFAEKIGEEPIPGYFGSVVGITAPKYAPHEGEPRDFPFYTLRVCKRCRAEWMHMIETWFLAKPPEPDGDAYTQPETLSHGIYIRDKGQTRLATDAEVAEILTRNPD